jgi:hypothetical protein
MRLLSLTFILLLAIVLLTPILAFLVYGASILLPILMLP